VTLDVATAECHQQHALPLARYYDKVLTEPPKDLYIPPDALAVVLEAFEGPLDLLLYLIRRQNLDILDIPVAQITQQYIAYIELMQVMSFELAAEYLVMAAFLAEIKSRFLLPRPPAEDQDEEDPRAALVRRLQEYERFKKAAEELDQLPRLEREFFLTRPQALDMQISKPQPEVSLAELVLALSEVLKRCDQFQHHQVQKESLSTRQRMGDILAYLKDRKFVPFIQLFNLAEGRQGIVTSFLALLELAKAALIDLVQSEPFAAIHVKACVDLCAEDSLAPVIVD
jgi:segregation and condensation protein A